MKRNNQKVVQTSSFLLQGWRANVDVQFLICDQGIDGVTASDIARVMDHIVSCICKGTKTMVNENFTLNQQFFLKIQPMETRLIFAESQGSF